MKKLLLLAILVLTFTLSGCGELKYEGMSDTQRHGYCSKTGNYLNDDCTEYWKEQDDKAIHGDIYYTQEEVDELIIDLQLEFSNLLLEYYVMYDRENELLISMCYIEGMQKQCDFSLEIEELQVTCPTEPLPAMSTEEFRAYLLVEYPDLAPYFRFNEEELE